ncbi:hypothetical protein NKH18_47890 [Streptomyces sp. M10(2022)]
MARALPGDSSIRTVLPCAPISEREIVKGHPCPDPPLPAGDAARRNRPVRWLAGGAGRSSRRPRILIDGLDLSGKTTLTDALLTMCAAQETAAVRHRGMLAEHHPLEKLLKRLPLAHQYESSGITTAYLVGVRPGRPASPPRPAAVRRRRPGPGRLRGSHHGRRTSRRPFLSAALALWAARYFAAFDVAVYVHASPRRAAPGCCVASAWTSVTATASRKASRAVSTRRFCNTSAAVTTRCWSSTRSSTPPGDGPADPLGRGTAVGGDATAQRRRLRTPRTRDAGVLISIRQTSA